MRLNLDFNYIMNEGALKLSQGLRKLTNLKHLDLGVAVKNFGTKLSLFYLKLYFILDINIK